MHNAAAVAFGLKLALKRSIETDRLYHFADMPVGCAFAVSSTALLLSSRSHRTWQSGFVLISLQAQLQPREECLVLMLAQQRWDIL